jgi:hypothetical protein
MVRGSWQDYFGKRKLAGQSWSGVASRTSMVRGCWQDQHGHGVASKLVGSA